MLIGYARTSTREQVAGYEAQIADLENEGCEKIFREQVSALSERIELNDAIDFVREGDALVVTKLDRLARSVPHLCKIVELLEAKKVSLRILSLGLDSSTPHGKLMLNMLGAIAQFERELMLERQKDGIQAAKLKGKYKGRIPTAMAKEKEVLSLASQNVTRQKIADATGIGIASVYRILAINKVKVTTI